MAQMTGRRSSTLLSSAIVEHSLLTLSILGTHIAIEQLMIAWVATLRPADDLSSTSRTFSRFATLGSALRFAEPEKNSNPLRIYDNQIFSNSFQLWNGHD
jgi:hypothetical protein